MGPSLRYPKGVISADRSLAARAHPPTSLLAVGAYFLGVFLRTAIVALVASMLSVPTNGWAQRERPVLHETEYDAAMAHASALEARKEYRRAAELLDAIAPRFPEDYALHLRRGYLWSLAGDYARSLACYRLASDLSGGSLDANLGLGYALLGLERCPEARPYFDAVLGKDPHHKVALKGLRICQSPVNASLNLSVAPLAQIFQNHPYLQGAIGVTVAAHGHPHPRFGLGAVYRNTQFALQREARARGQRWSSQNELHVNAEIYGERFGATFDYGFVRAKSAPLDRAHVVGAILRYSPWGHITLEGSASIYADQTVGRIVPAWSVPLGSHVFIRPAAALQPTRDRLYWAPELSVYLTFDGYSLFASGRAGESLRPVWLEQPAIYNTLDLLAEGASAGGSFRLGGATWLDLAYEMQRRRVEVEDPASASTRESIAFLHLIVLGLHLTR